MDNYKLYKNSSREKPLYVSRAEYDSTELGQHWDITPNADYNSVEFSIIKTPQNWPYFRSIKNILNSSTVHAPEYNYESLKDNQISLGFIRSYSSGDGIQPGTVQLTIASGSEQFIASDSKENGILYSGSVGIGFVLYKHGIIITNNELVLINEDFDAKFSKISQGVPTIAPESTKLKWNIFGCDNTNRFIEGLSTLDFTLNYAPINSTPSLINFAIAEKGELNHSNNPTFLSSSYQETNNATVQSDSLYLLNTVQSSFVSGSADFAKQTFISSIGLYDKNKKLIAVAKLANPIRKTEYRELLFKLKLDI